MSKETTVLLLKSLSNCERKTHWEKESFYFKISKYSSITPSLILNYDERNKLITYTYFICKHIHTTFECMI